MLLCHTSYPPCDPSSSHPYLYNSLSAFPLPITPTPLVAPPPHTLIPITPRLRSPSL